MSEIKIQDNIIIDEVETVIQRIEMRTGFRNIDVQDIVNFINNEPATKFYIDEKMNSNLEPNGSRYLWLDTGFEDRTTGKPIFISLVNSYGEYVGHYAGHCGFLSQSISNYFPQNTRFINTNAAKFENRYEQRGRNRQMKHLTEKYMRLAGKEPEGIQENQSVGESDNNKLKQEHIQKMKSYDMADYHSAEELVKLIRPQLMIDNWKTQGGLERYLKIVGDRIWQLVQRGEEDFYVINKARSVIVNSGLMDKYGEDIKLMYRVNLTTNSYSIYQLVISKKDFLENDFSREQANREIKPVSFLEKGEVFEVTMDEFDINTRCLIHIIEERRSRFPLTIQDMPEDRLARRITEALDMSLKLQQRDRTYIKPSFSGKYHKVCWFIPLHINTCFSEEPEMVLVIDKHNDFYEVKTVLPYNDEIKDRITALSLYAKCW